jgi:hypothetical protein
MVSRSQNENKPASSADDFFATAEEADVDVTVMADAGRGLVILDFGVRVSAMGLTPDDATDIAAMLVTAAAKCQISK